MDENQNTHEEIHTTTTTEHHNDCRCNEIHPLIKCILTGLLIFAGAFLASYVLLDWHTKAMFMSPRHSIDKAIEHDMKMMNKIMRVEKNFANTNANLVHMEQTNQGYKIIIDLKPFDNNADNVTVSKEDKVLTISGRSVKKTNNNEQISRFQQSYVFGDNVDLDNMQQKVEGHYLVVKIPTTKTENETDD